MAIALLQQPPRSPMYSRSASSYSAHVDASKRAELDFETRAPRTIDELIKLRAAQAGCNDPIICYPEHGTAYKEYTPKDLDNLVEQAACTYARFIPQRCSSNDPVQVVAMLGDSDLSYLVSLLAISRLGHTALLLSTRITDEAYESLLSATEATVLLYHTSYSAGAETAASKFAGLQIANIVTIGRLQRSANKLPSAELDSLRETSNRCFIIHSSGSTGLPKPIYQTHSTCLHSYSQHYDLVAFVTLPIFHNHGICTIFRAIHARRKIYMYNARLPLASKHLLSTLKDRAEIRILNGVPYVLKLLAETAEGLRLLSRLDVVMFGGSACPKPIGDKLVNSGVNLVGHYGATEVSQLMTSSRDFKNDKGWDWLRVPERLMPYLSMEPRGPNLYECCVKEGWGSKVATNRDDGSYATKDLFEPHPTLPDTWRYYARLDDTIVLENGEKANPLEIEGVLRQNRNIAEAVVFGTNKAQLGAFIIPKPEVNMSREQLLDAVMPSIDKLNQALPAFSHLSRDMIHVLAADAKYRTTDKGTVIRAAFYRDFAEQIDAMYLDTNGGTDRLAREELLIFLRQEFATRLSSKGEVDFDDNTDLFSLGVDSLQAIQIRSAILKTLDLGGHELGRNFVFDFPTLNLMADEILRLQSGGPEVEKASVEERMASMVKKYSDFDRHQPVDRPAYGGSVVVTGATGSLGAHVVARLCARDNVQKVYCLVRASDNKMATARVEKSLRARRVFDGLSLNALQKIIALPSDFSDSLLGLGYAQYDELAHNITHVLHLAWSVNFNKGLESFEHDCIAGARNLINLCLRVKRPWPATFNFCSSVSATARTQGGVVPEALPESYAYAQGMGYAQSKLVTETLCDQAFKQRGIKARVLRVGQIIGDTQHGIWNADEAIPMIFQTAKTIGALPKLDENPTWLPVDIVAQAFIDIGCSDTDDRFFNLVNAKSFHWTHDLLPLVRQAGLEFEEVDQREWVRRLRESDSDPAVNPPIKLVEFFASKYDTDEKRPVVKYETDVAERHSAALQEAGVIDGDLVGKVVEYLRGIGCLWF